MMMDLNFLHLFGEQQTDDLEATNCKESGPFASSQLARTSKLFRAVLPDSMM